MRQYIKQRFADWLLCVGMAACMTQALCSGFVLEEGAYCSVVVIFALSAAIQALLQLISYRRRFVIIGIIAGAALASAAVITIKTTQIFTTEGAGDRLIFTLILFAASLLVFLLTRMRTGTATLFLLGTLTCTGAYFLQFPIMLWSLLVFEIAVSAMFFFRVYTVSLFKADIGKVRIGAYMLQTGVVCLAAFALAGGIYRGVVRPLDPPTQEVRLITRLQSMPLLEVLGVSDTKVIFDSELASQQTPDTVEFSSDTGDEQNESIGEEPLQTGSQNNGSSFPGFISDVQQTLDTVNYGLLQTSYVWLLLLIPLLLAGTYDLRLFVRKRWQQRVRSLPKEDAAANYYCFFLKCFKRLGVKRGNCHTLREYVENYMLQLQAFSAEDISFAALTGTYEKILYGGGNISAKEYEQFETYYGSFYENLRRELGTLKYCMRIFEF
jgi:hypothetical protein